MVKTLSDILLREDAMMWMNAGYNQKFHDSLNAIDDLFAALYATEDSDECVANFLEKRKPNRIIDI